MKTALTIGFFDGVHLGHQALLKRLKEKSCFTTILTFSNHPQSLFHSKTPDLLLTPEEKLSQLKKYADEVIMLRFTLEFASTPFQKLLSQFDLSYLILGEGSVFGKNREGNEANVKKYAKEKGFVVEYIPKFEIDGLPVSSSRIRKAMAEGDDQLVKRLLGRSFHE